MMIGSNTTNGFQNGSTQVEDRSLLAIVHANNTYDKAAVTNLYIEASWCEIGLTLSDVGQYEHALDSYNRALELNPRSPTVLNRFTCSRADNQEASPLPSGSG